MFILCCKSPVSKKVMVPKIQSVSGTSISFTLDFDMEIRKWKHHPIGNGNAPSMKHLSLGQRNAPRLLLFLLFAFRRHVATFAPETNHCPRRTRRNQYVALRQQDVAPRSRIRTSAPPFQSRFILRKQQGTWTVATMSSSSLFLLLDVPDDFFTLTFPMLGILLSISKNFARIRMEERAWEQRLEEGRAEYLRRHPSLTELDLRRKEAAQEWSAYGVPRRQQEEAEEQREAALQRENVNDPEERQRDFRNRVSVLDREDEDDNNPLRAADAKDRRIRKEDYCMTEEEIELFEQEYGVVYDPYYDDPYYVDELPGGKCEIDKLYGDRIYPNGEIFYKDAKTGLYYRQGSKPRNLSFFG
jgi:hypothetical protein